MPQLQAIVLADREATPVNHNFVPRDIVDGIGTVVNSTGVMIGEETLTIGLRKAQTKARPKMVIKVPVVQNSVVNGITVPTVVRTGYVTIEATFDASSTTQERNNIMGMAYAALTGPSKALIHDTFVNLQGVY